MRLIAAIFLGACGATQPVSVDPGEASGGDDGGKADGSSPASTAVPDVHCAGVPDAGPAGSFRHFTSNAIALGSPRHRGLDLIAAASDDTQTLSGWISYSTVDKALEDEDVDVYACRTGAWHYEGTVTTDGEGMFALALSGGDRLPIAMRDLYVSVVGDRTGIGFVGYVAPDDQPLVVSDVDGTLTASENAFAEDLVLGGAPDAQPDAAHAYQAAKTAGYQLVYVTARGSQYTEATRQWLADQGFPRGPVRLSPSFVTLPNGDTVAFKTSAIGALPLPIARGIGNRASDITAYTDVGLAPSEIFILDQEYASEDAGPIAAGQATGFDSYAALPPL